MDKQHRMIGSLDRLDETRNESSVDVLGASARSVLKHSHAVDNDVGVQAGDELSELVGAQRDERTFDDIIFEGVSLPAGEPARHRCDGEAPARQVVGHRLSDQVPKRRGWRSTV